MWVSCMHVIWSLCQNWVLVYGHLGFDVGIVYACHLVIMPKMGFDMWSFGLDVGIVYACHLVIMPKMGVDTWSFERNGVDDTNPALRLTCWTTL